MADKLRESVWTDFTKKARLSLDDGPLVKALARFDKTSESKPEPRLEALNDVVEQIKHQVTALAKKKKELGDKSFGEAKDKLYSLLDAGESLQKDLRIAIDEAAAAEDEADTPALLTTKMLPLVRELRKGEARMHALACTAGRNTAVLIMRRPIAPSRRKLLAEAVDAAGGAKYIAGECLFEDKALTFVVQSPAAGLAKRLRQALLDQLQLRLKVKVRGDDGAEDIDGEDEEGAAETAEATAAGIAEGTADAGAALKARLAALVPRIKDAAASGHPAAQDVKLKASEAGVFAGKKDYAHAHALLDEAEALLSQRPAATAATQDPQALLKRMNALSPRVKQAVADDLPFKDVILRTVATFQEHLKAGQLPAADQALTDLDALLQGAARPAQGYVDYAKARLVWLAARNNVKSDLQKLERQIIDEYKDEPAMLPAVTRGVRRLDRILAALDESLADKLDEGLNASDASQRALLNRQAADIIQGYLDFLDTDALVAAVEDNPFTPIRIEGPLRDTLTALAGELA
jgi:hypothetical protein